MHQHILSESVFPRSRDLSLRLALLFGFLSLLMIVSYVFDGMTLSHNIYMDYTLVYFIASLVFAMWALALRGNTRGRLKHARLCTTVSMTVINIILTIFDVLVYTEQSGVEDAGEHSVFFLVLVFSSLIHIVFIAAVFFVWCSTICLFIFFTRAETREQQQRQRHSGGDESAEDFIVLTATYEE